MPQARHLGSDVLQFKAKSRDGGVRRPSPEGSEDENARLKRLLAEQMLDNAILKDVAAKK